MHSVVLLRITEYGIIRGVILHVVWQGVVVDHDIVDNVLDVVLLECVYSVVERVVVYVVYSTGGIVVLDMVVVLCCVHVVCAPNHCVKIKI